VLIELDKNMYSVSISLGATINMASVAVTISVLTLGTVNKNPLPLSYL